MKTLDDENFYCLSETESRREHFENHDDDLSADKTDIALLILGQLEGHFDDFQRSNFFSTVDLRLFPVKCTKSIDQRGIVGIAIANTIGSFTVVNNMDRKHRRSKKVGRFITKEKSRI